MFNKLQENSTNLRQTQKIIETTKKPDGVWSQSKWMKGPKANKSNLLKDNTIINFYQVIEIKVRKEYQRE